MIGRAAKNVRHINSMGIRGVVGVMTTINPTTLIARIAPINAEIICLLLARLQNH